MKMESGRPASPAGGPGPDPEPGGPGAASAPARGPGLGPQDPAAGVDAGRSPGWERRPQRAGGDPDPDPDPDSDPDLALPELGPLFSWTMEPEGDGPAHSASVRAQDFSRSHHLRGEVDFFPSFAAPEVGDPALELGPEDPNGPSDFSQTHPLTSEPAGCPEDSPRLRAVFDALDGDGDGFVRIEDFVQFATVYGAEQVTRRVRAGLARWSWSAVEARGPASLLKNSPLLPSPLAEFAEARLPPLKRFYSLESVSFPAIPSHTTGSFLN